MTGQAFAFSPCLRNTATAYNDDTNIHLSQTGSVACRVLPVLPHRQLTDTQITEIIFSPRGTHLAVVCETTEAEDNDNWAQGWPDPVSGESSDPDAYVERCRNYSPHHDSDMETKETQALYRLELASGQAKRIFSGVDKEEGERELSLAWAPSGRLAAHSGSQLLIARASGGVREHDAPRDAVSCMAWQPDSRQLFMCVQGGLFAIETGRDAAVTRVELHGWLSQEAVFLPCRWHGCHWAALALRRKSFAAGFVALITSGGALVDSEMLPAGEPCTTLAASCQHVVTCSPASMSGAGSVHIFSIESAEHHLFLQPQRCITLHTQEAACALSACGVWLAVLNKAPNVTGRKRSVTGEAKLHSLQLQIESLVPHVALARALPIKASLADSYASLQWASDSSRLAMQGADQARVYIFCS